MNQMQKISTIRMGALFAWAIGMAVCAGGQLPNLNGRYEAFYGTNKAADCEIIQQGNSLVFIVRLPSRPEVRTSGHFVDLETTRAAGWASSLAKIRNDGHRLEWEDGAYWLRAQAKSPPTPEGYPAAMRGQARGYIFDNYNKMQVTYGAARSPEFVLHQPARIQVICAYHWNGGKGVQPGTLGLRDQTGRIYGPWKAYSDEDLGGPSNMDWVAFMDITLPPGTYAIVDSDMPTWSHNSQSGGAGFCRVGHLKTPASGRKPLVSGASGLSPISLPPITVTREQLVAEGQLAAKGGGTVSTPDGLTLGATAGSPGGPYAVKIYKAKVAPPSIAFGLVGQPPEAANIVRAWDVDAGTQLDLFPAPVEVTIDVGDLKQADGQYPLLLTAISIDGRRWTFMPNQLRDGKLSFRTRHLCPLLVMTPLAWKGLGVLALASGYYLYDKGWEGVKTDLATEMPSVFADPAGATAPWNWVSLGPEESGFQIYWAPSLAGNASGLADEAGFKTAIKSLILDSIKGSGTGPDGNANVNDDVQKKIDRIRKEYLQPMKVRMIDDALQVAAKYIESRGFKRPYLTVPVYVVPSLNKDCGYMRNPWLGRRYMVFGANQDTDDIYATALHELFHHYQSGYHWYTADRQGHVPVTEASALLLEREAESHYAGLRPLGGGPGVKISTDIATMNVYQDGLFSSPADLGVHGYGLSWFLEYLRDEGHAGSLKFHQAFLEKWAGLSGSMFKTYIWAAGEAGSGSGEERLGTQFIQFARRKVLNGMTAQTPYGKKYSRPVFKGDPHVDLDCSVKPVHEFTDAMIKPWSIQYYRFKPGQDPKAKLVIKVPDEWFTYRKPGRALFVRKNVADADVVPCEDLNIAKGLGKDVFMALPFNAEIGLYIVDTGQSGSGWVSDYKPAQAFMLESPPEVRAVLLAGRRTMIVSWALTSAAKASLINRHFIYLPFTIPGKSLKIARVGSDTLQPVVQVNGQATAVEIDLGRECPTTPEFRVTSAIQIGTQADGTPLYLESHRSDMVALGQVSGFVGKREDELDPSQMSGPFADSVPCPGVQVTLAYTVKGQRTQVTATTDANGAFTASVPMGSVDVTARGETKTVTCTPQNPQAGVSFGWGGPEIHILTPGKP